MIKLSGLTKNYSLNPVLRGVNLHVKENEFVALVGPNGAGKTTLLRIVATLQRPGAGTVTVGGWSLPNDADRVRRHIGMISHQPMVYGDLNAIDNLMFYAGLYGLQEPTDRVMTLLDTVGLKRRVNDPVRTFSRGMMQRLAIARATLHDPDVLLLDEPYTGLDSAAVHLLNELLAEQHAIGRTILMITHDFVNGLSQCQRVAILNKGKIVTEIDTRSVTTGEFIDYYRSITQPKL
ncbi:MAG: heme exporter protein A [Cellvibrionaceae bacterium]|jgi:heme exporter protein A